MSQIYALSGTIVLVALAIGLVLAYLTFLRKAGPNEVIVVSGRGPVRFITGGAGMVVPLFSTWNRLSLEIMTLDVTTPEVYTSQGVPVIVDGVAQIKIKKDRRRCTRPPSASSASAPRRSRKIALETVQGHLRAILGTMSVEDIYKNRDQFAQKVQEVSAGDLANMGLGIDSFTIRDIRDKHGYLEALGKPRIAEVKRTAAIAEAIAFKEASIAQADAERETRERQAEALKLAQEAEAKRDAAVAEANADKQRRQREADAASNRAAEIANFQAQQAIAEQQAVANRKRAEAEMAYELQKKTMEIQVQEQEIKRKEKELDATIRRQADAKRYETETLAAAARTRIEAEAGAERARLEMIAEGEQGPRAGRGGGGRRRRARPKPSRGAGARPRRSRVAQGAGPRRGARHGEEGRGVAEVQRGRRAADPRADPARDRARDLRAAVAHRPHHDGQHRRRTTMAACRRSPPRSRGSSPRCRRSSNR